MKVSLIKTLFLSLLLHLIIIGAKSDMLFFQKKEVTQKRKFKIHTIRNIGEEDKTKDYIQLAKKPKRKAIPKKSLAFNPIENEIIKKQEPVKKESVSSLLKPSEKGRIKFKAKANTLDLKKFLQSNPNQLSASSQLRKLDDTDALFNFEIPKGVKEDELNKQELVFYSFRKRAAVAYMNSFIKELNKFERQNPHLRFPMTKKLEEIAGRITYDENGDILKIETLKWSNIDKLQDFFLDVLNNMSSLPNPPDSLINEQRQFVVNFILTVNGTRFQ